MTFFSKNGRPEQTIEIAYNIIMLGPPGSGKTMLAMRLPSILPKLALEESLEKPPEQHTPGRLGGEAYQENLISPS